ncbi:MAG: hypothetical protein ACOXZ3_04940 [Synergistaceae bacterium]
MAVRKRRPRIISIEREDLGTLNSSLSLKRTRKMAVPTAYHLRSIVYSSILALGHTTLYTPPHIIGIRMHAEKMKIV